MSQQEEGWPLGLQPLNVRVGLVRHTDFSGSISFNTTLVSASISSSTDSSSDLDTESTGSFFHDKSITLGSLIGVSTMLDHLPRRSTRGRKSETLGDKKSHRTRTWCFSLCPTDSTDAESTNNNNNNNNAPSLGHFLEVERRAANEHRRNHNPIIYGPDELALAQHDTEPNSLFVNGCIAPPRSSPWPGSDERRQNREFESCDGYGVPVALFSCMCGHSN
ncbi:uncharacterized protein At3g17950-like [Cornus florida]|uniref:uncharacterized protein At3g17950-like n=1 Tax=Cornus florida TaxID=4283 RepID=UPI0028A1B6CE|nr:uncharacterized protein At3g17950-like [Cornus florida]